MARLFRSRKKSVINHECFSCDSTDMSSYLVNKSLLHEIKFATLISYGLIISMESDKTTEDERLYGNSDLSELNTTLKMNRFERPAASALRVYPDQVKEFFNASQSSSEFMSAADLIRQPKEGYSVDRFVPTNNKKGTVEIERETRNLSSGCQQSDSQNMRATVEVLSEVNRERPSREVRKQATPKFHAPSEKRNSSVSRSTNCASFIGDHDHSVLLENALKSKELSSIGIQNERNNDDDDENTRYTMVLFNPTLHFFVL